MDKELEILKNLSRYLQLKIDNGEHKIIYNDLMWDEKTIDCINAIETLIRTVENSIDKSVVLEKLNKKKQEREIYWLENEIMLNFIHDEKRATISLEELKINDKSMELLGEIKCLQELLQKNKR